MAVSQVRTQIYLPKQLYQRLKRLAERRKVSKAAIVRDAIEAHLKQELPASDWENDPIWNIVGAFASRQGDLSVRHDDYLYGPISERAKRRQ